MKIECEKVGLIMHEGRTKVMHNGVDGNEGATSVMVANMSAAVQCGNSIPWKVTMLDLLAHARNRIKNAESMKSIPQIQESPNRQITASGSSDGDTVRDVRLCLLDGYKRKSGIDTQDSEINVEQDSWSKMEGRER